MKRLFAMSVIFFLTAFMLNAYSADYNNAGATIGSQMKEQPVTGISTSVNKPGVYDFKPKATATPQQADDKNTKKSGDNVVTPRHILEAKNLVPRNIDVITSDRIAQSGAQSLSDIIESLSGFTVLKYGGYEGINTAMLYGGPSTHTLVMQDGVPINDILTGTADLNLIDISNIEKIEVIKENMASMYGEGASSGVINVLTGSAEKKILKAQAQYGSFDTQRYAVASNYTVFKVDYSASVSEDKSGGYIDNADYLKRCADLKLHLDGDLLTSSVYGHYLSRQMGVPYNENGKSPDARQQDENYSINADEDVKVPYVNMKVLGFIRSADMFFKDPDISADARHIKKEYQFSTFFTYNTKDILSIVTGYENNIKEVNSSVIGKRSVDNQASISSLSAKLFSGVLVGNMGFRADFNSIYMNSTNENLSLKVKMADSTELYASYGKSFDTPSFGDTFWPADVSYAGNLNLKREKTTSLKAGIEKKGDIISEEISCFRNVIEDMIIWEYDPDSKIYSPVNIANAEITGAEAKVNLKISDIVTTYAGYTYLAAKDKATKNVLPYRPQNEVNAGMNVKLPFSTGIKITGKYVDNRTSASGGLLHPYYLLNARLTHKISSNFEIFADMNNALNNITYEYVDGYMMPGRTLMVGIKAEI